MLPLLPRRISPLAIANNLPLGLPESEVSSSSEAKVIQLEVS
jgi:hypothetical protein